MLQALLGCLTLCVGTANSADGTDDWLKLDRELSELASSASADAGGARVSGYLRTFYAFQNDAPAFAGSPNDDVSGFFLDRVRLEVDGEAGKVALRTRVEAAGGVVRLLDAYASCQCSEYFQATMGRFQTPLYWNGMLDPKNNLFILRTASDEFWIGGQPAKFDDNVGVMVNGTFDRFHWWASVQNGVDGTADDFAFTGRVRVDVLGGGVGMVEGAYGAKDDAALSAEVGYFDDEGALDAGGSSVTGGCFVFDTEFTMGRISANAEILDYSKDAVNVFDTPDTTPWAVAASYMISPNTWEAAARYQDVDTPTNLRDVTVGVNRYVVGHDVKWQLNVVRTLSDSSVEESTSVAVGLTVGK
jgi:hypothetical protein